MPCKNPDYCGTGGEETLCVYCSSEEVQRPLRLQAALNEIEAAVDYSLVRRGQRTRPEIFNISQAKWLKDIIEKAR